MRAEQQLDERVQAIIWKLRERGQRLTPQRLAIIRNFLSREDHPSAEAIYREFHGDFPMMAISTVYKTLHALVAMGEAIEVSPATPETRFDPNTGNHCHLVCVECRSIQDFPMEQDPPELPEGIAGGPDSFEPMVHVHQVYGYCANCRSDGKDD